MIDLTNLTQEEANRIRSLLLLLEPEVRSQTITNEALSEDYDLSEEARKIFESNTRWYKETYRLIYGKEFRK